MNLVSACSLASDNTGTPPSPPRGVHSGGVLRVGITAPGGIDPLDAYEPVGKMISSALCDTLISLDPQTGQVREALAKGWVLSGGTSMTIKLRHGIKFTNGQELGSRDVNYSLQQLISTSNGSYVASLAQQFAAVSLGKQDTGILADPDRAATIAFGVSRHDFQLTDALVSGGALRAFAEPAMAPVSQSAESADPSEFASDPVCVGPYRLSKPYRGDAKTIRLVRSKGYYGENVGYTSGGVGYADQIVFRIYPSAKAVLKAYDDGKVDVVEVPRTDVARTKDTASRVFGLATGTEFLGLPGNSAGPFSDPDVRIALSEAIDRTKLVKDVFGPDDQVADGFVPPALAISPGRSLDDKMVKGAPLATCGASTPAAPRLAAARALLAKAATRPGATPFTGFTLDVNNDAPYPAMARELAAQWRSGLGLHVKVKTMPWQAYKAKGEGSPGFTSPFRVRWASDATAPLTTYNDQQVFYAPLAGSAATTLANWSHFSDRKFDFALLSTVSTVTDVQERGTDFRQLGSMLCQQMPVIPLAFDRPAFLVRSTAVGSARPVPVGRDGVLMLRELYLK
ncbi:MAG TPA: ABC transporter substrate-binding protein [Mycobacteriales bacterium]|nr:ABC transporter substrate-binding protein [Mycobacteriales bacterium]